MIYSVGLESHILGDHDASGQGHPAAGGRDRRRSSN